MMKKLTLFAIPLTVFLILVILLWQALGKDPQTLPSALLNQPVPEFRLTALDHPEQIITAADLRGQPALINVWATWCASCLVEHPLLNQLAKEGVRIVGINYKDQRSVAQQYLQVRGNPFTQVIFDELGSLGFDLGVYGAPETFIVDAQGVIRERFVGVLSEAVWREKLGPIYSQLLNKPIAPTASIGAESL